MTALRGIDVSSYQDHVKWFDVKKFGHTFAMAKATEGLHYRDPTFPYNWEYMNNAGLVRGAYHFLHPDLDGRAQAHFHHAYVRDSGHYCAGDFIAVDVEVDNDKPAEVVIDCLRDFIETALTSISKQVVLYTGTYFWRKLGNPKDKLFTNRPLWLADYDVKPPPPLPGWDVLSFWQYTDRAKIMGVYGPCDADIFFGDKDQLAKVLKWP